MKLVNDFSAFCSSAFGRTRSQLFQLRHCWYSRRKSGALFVTLSGHLQAHTRNSPLSRIKFSYSLKMGGSAQTSGAPKGAPCTQAAPQAIATSDACTQPGTSPTLPSPDSGTSEVSGVPSMEPRLLIIAGPSGVGKGTLVRRLRANWPNVSLSAFHLSEHCGSKGIDDKRTGEASREGKNKGFFFHFSQNVPLWLSF